MKFHIIIVCMLFNNILGINAGIVKMVCEGINNCKTGISKQDNCHYKFEYVKKARYA